MTRGTFLSCIALPARDVSLSFDFIENCRKQFSKGFHFMSTKFTCHWFHLIIRLISLLSWIDQKHISGNDNVRSQWYIKGLGALVIQGLCHLCIVGSEIR